jgi:hypothetical protein
VSTVFEQLQNLAIVISETFFELQDSATVQKQLTLLPLSFRMQKILLRTNVEIHLVFFNPRCGSSSKLRAFPQIVIFDILTARLSHFAL